MLKSAPRCFSSAKVRQTERNESKTAQKKLVGDGNNGQMSENLVPIT